MPGVGVASKEMATVKLLVVDADQDRYDDGFVVIDLVERLDEAWNEMRSLEYQVRALGDRPTDQRLCPHRDGRRLLAETDDEPVPRMRYRLPYRFIGLEAR